MTRPDKSALLSLRDRLREAEEGGWELDRDIGFALDGWTYLPTENLLSRNSDCRWINNGVSIFAERPGSLIEPAYTASLDASIALVGRVLPGWGVCVRQNDRGENWWAEVWLWGGPKDPVRAYGWGASLALLLAMVEALIAGAEE